jgi:hypothetical protein
MTIGGYGEQHPGGWTFANDERMRRKERAGSRF